MLRRMVTDILERVRAALKQGGVTPAGLARKAGLHRNSLYKAADDDWNPTAEVLTKLEPHILAIERGEWSGDLPDNEEPAKAAA
jgi:ribosome-binding protein aMBF1 (putative translation factor)